MRRWIIPIMAGAAVIRCAGIAQPLWYDEAYTAMLVRLPFAQMIQATVYDVHPPTWYLVDRAFTSVLGTSEIALRIPSFILGMLSIYLAWRLAEDLLGDQTALVVAMLMAISPFAVYYSNEARMYALLMASALGATVGIIERKAALTAISTAVMLLSHNTALMYLTALVLLAWPRVGLKRTAITLGMGVAPWLAWLPFMLNQVGKITQTGYWIWNVTGNRIAFMIAQMNELMFRSVPDWLIPINIMATCVFAVFPLVEAIKRRHRDALTLAMLAFTPMLCGLAVSIVYQPLTIARTLAGCLPAWLMLVAWWLMLPRQWTITRVALTSVALATFVAANADYLSYDRSMGMRGAADFLTQHVKPTEIVCHSDASSTVLTRYYFPGNVAVLDVPRDAMTDVTMGLSGISIVPESECSWMLYAQSPLLDASVKPRIERILHDRRAEIAYTIFQSSASRAEIWRLDDVDHSHAVRAH
jgi:4-amino-4-deoxy-L-arabinose transferase-like glycosyltransferase